MEINLKKQTSQKMSEQENNQFLFGNIIFNVCKRTNHVDFPVLVFGA